MPADPLAIRLGRVHCSEDSGARRPACTRQNLSGGRVACTGQPTRNVLLLLLLLCLFCEILTFRMGAGRAQTTRFRPPSRVTLFYKKRFCSGGFGDRTGTARTSKCPVGSEEFGRRTDRRSARCSGPAQRWSWAVGGASLRGAAPGQVAVFVDGVPLSRGSQSAVDLSQLPLDGLERVEVYRGVAPLELGSETLGGAINLVTRRGQGPPSAWLSLGSGSFGLRRASVGYKAPSPRLLLSAAYRRRRRLSLFFNEGLRYGREQLDELRRKTTIFPAQRRCGVEAETRAGSLYVHSSGLLRRQGVAGIGQPSSQPGQPDLQTGRVLLDGGVRLRTPTPRVQNRSGCPWARRSDTVQRFAGAADGA